MKKIHPSKLIQSEMFVKEPVDKICRELERTDIDRIILIGRGNGKSVLLERMQERKAVSKNPFLLAKFDLARFSMDLEQNPIYTEDFLRHYCEEQMVFQILWYIKNYYEFTYRANFTKYSDFIHESHKKTVQYINDSVHEKQSPLKLLLSTQELFGEILENFKKYCYTNAISLGIDRFDWIVSERAQHILSEYFSLFSNCLITTDDETITNEWYKTYFKENSMLYTFSPYNIDYGKNIDVVKLIFEKRIKDYNNLKSNKEYFKPFPSEFFTNEIIELLIKSTDGNISLMLDILKNLIDKWSWSERVCLVDIQNAINACKGHRLQLTKTKLYI